MGINEDRAGHDPRHEAAIDVRALTKSFGDTEVVRGVDLSITRGEVFGILGPNGAGKTTTIDCLAGLSAATSGSVRVLGLDPVADRAAFTARVAVQPQAASLFDHLTVAETLRLFASFHERPAALEPLLAEVGLTANQGIRAKHLSGGQTRRLLLAVALIGDPELVILDEPAAGLDPSARLHLWSTIRALRDRGVTVLLTTHDMEEATALCDRVAILVRGEIVASGSPADLVRQSAGESTVRFVVAAGTDLGPVQRMEGANAVSSENVAGGIHVVVKTDDPDGLLRAITFTPGLQAREFAVHRSSLQDLFVELAENGSAGPASTNTSSTNTSSSNTSSTNTEGSAA
jgi:ABC-2 type transport system ATP-binding protein